VERQIAPVTPEFGSVHPAWTPHGAVWLISRQKRGPGFRARAEAVATMLAIPADGEEGREHKRTLYNYFWSKD
jgi:hypothetical protein